MVKELKVNGKEQARELTRVLISKARAEREPVRKAAAAVLSAKNQTLLETMHHRSAIDLMLKIEKHSLAVVHLDVPYANYNKLADGTLFANSSSNTDGDNNSRDAAIAITIAVLRAAVELPKRNGVILLWQSARRLPTQIAQVLDELQLIDHPFLIWNKERCVLGNPGTPTMCSTEICYFLTRKSEEPDGHDSKGREQVINVPYLRHRADHYEPLHQMQKPEEVNFDIIRRFTSPEDTILDAFGCTASMCIASEKLGRRWIYSESNAKNFELGKRNMENYLMDKEKKTA